MGYKGPIEPGMKFIWEPDIDYACEVITVVLVKEPNRDGKAWIETVNNLGIHVLNSEERLREAAVPYHEPEHRQQEEDDMPYTGPYRETLRFFEYNKLDPELQPVAKHFHALAHSLVNDLPETDQTKLFLQNLLAAKDCAVRAKMTLTT